MFEINDNVVYGNAGACRIIDIGKLAAPGLPCDKVYYTLTPYYEQETKMYVPVDNENLIMRKVISKEDAIELINNLDKVESLFIKNEKKRENEYKEAMRDCNCLELVKIIKTIHIRKQERIAEGKKIPAGDEKYFKIAEDKLYGELAIPFNMNKTEVKDFIQKKYENK